MRRRKGKTEKGFTLVELLVALAILSLIMVAFYTVFRGATSSYKKGAARVELIQNARIALDMMAAQIRQALPEDAGANPPIEFEIGEGTPPLSGPQIKFSAPIGVDDASSGPGVEEITFYLDDSNHTLYKKVNNPTYWEGTVADGEYYDPEDSYQQITADLPITETEGVVSYLWFEDAPPASRPGMTRITLTVKADPTDASDPGITLHAIVKTGTYYGIDLTGGF